MFAVAVEDDGDQLPHLIGLRQRDQLQAAFINPSHSAGHQRIADARLHQAQHGKYIVNAHHDIGVETGNAERLLKAVKGSEPLRQRNELLLAVIAQIGARPVAQLRIRRRRHKNRVLEQRQHLMAPPVNLAVGDREQDRVQFALL